ncbi:PREDICTED: ylmG homolog protein 1-2, chloroplastic-like [Nelumbo nucifera]|uniref:YlmG homolog protein 1-2, chloroplastic-like n=1 Tax=Nelumbo nucifera TaxID=4432 RepID=A0A1U7ZPN3_NELNU|nr:PREDICTED: ylmG homolog protein 1-2, chloroplastic-like [Nelumbo nucifera]
MASQTLIASTFSSQSSSPRLPKRAHVSSNRVILSLFSSPKPTPGLVLHRAKSDALRSTSRLTVCASSAAPVLPPGPSMQPSNATPSTLVSNSTRTVAFVVAAALTLPKVFAEAVRGFVLKLKQICSTPSHEELARIQTIKESLVCTIGPLFFAALRDRPSGYLNTPLTVVASGMAKWLDIYSGVLMVRVLLSWFPNIPWDRQPLSAIRDLCDPYLNLFRNIIPPVFDTLDVSPLLAFAVLGTLGSILNNSRGTY